jgi:uncharacterized cupin superfamily protein
VPELNLRTTPVEEDPRAREGRRFRRRKVGAEVGAKLTGFGIYELPAGEAAWPYHYELAREEWLVVVAGEPTLRTPEGERRVRPGDVVCFPIGPEGAHELRNDTGEPVRFALFSNVDSTSPTYHSDSDKLHVTDGGRRRIVRGSPELDYWEGEA